MWEHALLPGNTPALRASPLALARASPRSAARLVGGPVAANEVNRLAPVEYHLTTQFDDVVSSSSFAASTRRLTSSNKGAPPLNQTRAGESTRATHGKKNQPALGCLAGAQQCEVRDLTHFTPRGGGVVANTQGCTHTTPPGSGSTPAPRARSLCRASPAWRRWVAQPSWRRALRRVGVRRAAASTGTYLPPPPLSIYPEPW